MARMIGSFACGLIFGLGLLVSGMINPVKVLAFLDIFGAWDPSLAIVMAVALIVTYAGYTIARGRSAPLLAEKHFWPESTGIDRKLVTGAAMFGVGWGLSGLCPGPALENIVTLSPKLLVFVAMMIAGMKLRDWQQQSAATPTPRQAAIADG